MELGKYENKAPKGHWHCIGVYPEYTAWQKGDVCALSSTPYLKDEHLPPHYEWLVSFSKNGKERLTDKEMQGLLEQFDMVGALEDNHTPRVARKFWLACEPQYRIPCPCQDEEVIVEGDYRYSVKTPLTKDLPL